MKQYTREQVLERLRAKLATGNIIVAAGAGTPYFDIQETAVDTTEAAGAAYLEDLSRVVVGRNRAA